MKAITWETATGENTHGYNLVHFLDRNVGRHSDRSALRFTCQLRQQIADMTGECNVLPLMKENDAVIIYYCKNSGDKVFLRRGSTWYRNVEFGLPMTDVEKGQRSKKPLKPGFRIQGKFPDHYFGYYASYDDIESGKIS